MTVSKGARWKAFSASKAARTPSLWVIAATLSAAMAAWTPASATIVVDTYTGTVFTDAQIARFYPGNHNSDFTGIFGGRERARGRHLRPGPSRPS